MRSITGLKTDDFDEAIIYNEMNDTKGAFYYSFKNLETPILISSDYTVVRTFVLPEKYKNKTFLINLNVMFYAPSLSQSRAINVFSCDSDFVFDKSLVMLKDTIDGNDVCSCSNSSIRKMSSNIIKIKVSLPDYTQLIYCRNVSISLFQMEHNDEKGNLNII